MRKLTTVLGCLLMGASLSTFAAPKAAAWDYEANSGIGPNDWYKNYPACAEGGYQTPVDVPVVSKNKAAVTIHTHPKGFAGTVSDNGHGIIVSPPSLEAGFATIRNEPYSLLQFHFHAPSENTLNDKHFPIGLHFVMKDKIGELAVLGVWIKEGKPNPTLGKLLSALSNKESGGALSLSSAEIANLIPVSTSYVNFPGSLTTPPCSHGVTWFVLEEPIEASAEQIKGFTSRYDNNSRPIQPFYDRPMTIGMAQAAN